MRQKALLQRFHDATAAIARRPTTCTQENEGKLADGNTSQAPSLDRSILPVEDLLRRQARILSRNGGPSSRQHGALQAEGSMVLKRLDDLASIAMSKFYAYRNDRVPPAWRHLYTDTLVLSSYFHLVQPSSEDTELNEVTWNKVVENLDRALITTGGQSENLGAAWIEETMDMIDAYWNGEETDERPNKRQKTSTASTFSADEPFGRPQLSSIKECTRHQGWSLDKFEGYMNDHGDPQPVVFTDLISTWPALTDRPWKSVDYLLSKTLGGGRLVPIEIGRSYVDEGWGQELTPFKSFLEKYVLPGGTDTQVGYLAQHNLFRQIPSLRNDIQLPDFCWADVPGHPTDPAKNHAALDVPQLNAWFGPARTITPLHTDGYHNLLCQVVGSKYVRLYPPSATRWMRPRPPENGVDMSNTSAVDVGVVEGWDAVTEDVDEEELERIRTELKDVEYKECILGPGDTLLIPIGWWHYVRSLSVSFSVSFWWN